MRLKTLFVSLALAGLVADARAAFVLVEDFDSLTNGNLNNQNGWVSTGSGGQVTNDPSAGTNKVLSATTSSANIYKPLSALAIPEGATGTLFFRMRRANSTVNVSAGLSDTAAPTVLGDFEAQLTCNATTAGNLKVRDASATDAVDDFTNDVWYSVWLVVNNAADLVSVFMQGGALAGPTLLDGNLDGETAFTFRNSSGDGFNTNSAPVASNLVAFLIKSAAGPSHVGPFYVDDIYLDPGGTNLLHPLAPAPPTGLTATAADQEARLSWSASPGATNYLVKRAVTASGPFSTIATTEATSFTNAGLARGLTYYFVVSSLGANGEGPDSAPVSVTFAPEAPASLIATGGSSRVTLTWPAVTGATEYRIRRATGSGGPYGTVGTTAASPFTDTNVVNGTTYFYVVSAANAGGESAPSPEAWATPIFSDTEPPTIFAVQPAAGSVVAQLGAITVTFSEAVTNIAAAHLLINNAPATNLTGGGAVWTFRFPRPPYGPLTVSWASNHTIADLYTNRFNPTNATWTYFHTNAILDTTPPVITARVPAAGATISNLSFITVTFSEPVLGVEPDDLAVNGLPALGVTNAGQSYTFALSQPPPGPVSVYFDPDHGISDLAGNSFDEAFPGHSWSYTLLDSAPPQIALLQPAAGAVVTRLDAVEVFFSEPVTGVDVADLLINGVAATTNLTGSGVGPYVFSFPQPPTGTVVFAWADGHAIGDAFSNRFAGGSWSNRLFPEAPRHVVLNEILASNQKTTGLRDEDNELADWIELFNPGPTTVDLTGWSLSNDPDQPGLWTLPAVTMPPGTYLLVDATGKDRRPAPPGRLHTNFRLARDGEFLGLYNADYPRALVSAFAPNYPEQRNDYSFGYDTNGALRYFATPTPGTNNGGSALVGMAEPVSFSAPRGHYDAPFMLALGTPTAGATIRYTTDGSEPTATTGTAYGQPFTVSNTVVIRAAAFRADLVPSKTKTHTFIFPEQVLAQSNNPPGFPAAWVTYNNSVSVPADYALDARIITNPVYTDVARRALLALPTVSVSLPIADLFGQARGIYANPRQVGLNWERPASAEFIFPDGAPSAQVDAGLRIQGGTSREETKTYKHSTRLLFRGAYGPDEWRYPFFADSPVESFNTLLLDASLNLVWTHRNDATQRRQGQGVRDAFVSDLFLAAGWPSWHSRFCHVYFDGLYWGIHYVHERPDNNWAAHYYGGDPDNWDVLKNTTSFEAVSGDFNAWNQMLGLANAGLTNAAQYEALQQLCDVVNLADYMIINFWAGNTDWPHHNWYVGRERRPGARFRFFDWDNEHVLKDNAAQDFTAVANANTPAQIYDALRRYCPEWRLLFADRVHRLFFNGGVFYVNSNAPAWNPATPQNNLAAALYMKRITEVLDSVVLESARWGDTVANTIRPGFPYERNVEWSNELNRILADWFPVRSSNVLRQFIAQGLYPASPQAPVFNQHGGNVVRGYAAYMSCATPGATIYYTTNGVDPRVPYSGAVAAEAVAYAEPPILTSTVLLKARAREGTNWSALTEATFTVAALTPPVHITEIMFNPPGGDAYEFLELRNDGLAPLDVSGWSFDGLTFAFNAGTWLAPGQIIVLASSANPAAFAACYPGVAVFGYFGGRLDNAGERLALLDAAGRIVTSVDYGDSDGWPKAADGQGWSLETVDPFGDPDAASNWRATSYNGTPGTLSMNPPPAAVRLNEIMADNAGAVTNAGTFPDWIELHNASATAVDLTEWSLSDDSTPRKFVFPSNTVLAAGGFLVVWCDTNLALPGLHTGFQLDRDGETVSLFNAATTRVDALSFGLQLPDYTVGRIGADWVLTRPTPGATNIAAPTAGPANLSINEWLANAPPGAPDWIELFNAATNPVPLRGLWLARSNRTHRLAALSFLGPRRHLQLFADEQPGLAHLDFRLPAEGGFIALYDAAAVELQRVTYGPQIENVSQGRLPDGSGTITSFPLSPSPGTSNYVAAYTGPRLNELMAANRGAVTNRAGHTADWVELFNPLPTDFDLSGFRLSTSRDNPQQWLFPPAVVIPPNGHIVVWFDDALPASLVNETELNTGRALDGDSDEVYLFNPAGQIVDAVEFGPQAPDWSIGRVGGAWTLLATPTPGAANSAAAVLGSPSGLRVNEWLAAPPAGQDEFFELFNTGAQPVELSGLFLTDDLTMLGNTKFQIAPLSFIAPRGFTQFKADNDPGRGRHHVNFSLDAAAESLRIYSTNLGVIDTVVFSGQVEGVSTGRLPDGSTGMSSFACPTPGASNALASVITITAPPQSQSVAVGGRVTFTVTATGAGTLAYQWLHDEAPVPGAHSNRLTIENVQLADAGGYRVRVSNACASVTSAVATLTVTGLPEITAHPQSRTNTVGETVSFHVGVNSPLPPTYQWLFNSNALAGENGPTLALSSISPTHAGEYRVIVRTDAGAVVSEPAVLTVVGPPVLSEPRWLGTDGFRFVLSGQLFRDYAIEISPTPTNWSNAFTVRLTNGPQPVLDATATNAGPRLYRARLLP